MIRFRSYNDLLRLKRPKLDEDGLEIISVGMAGAAALAPVSSVLVTPEPEAVPVMEAKSEPVSEPEIEFESVPESEPAPVMAVRLEPEPEAVPVMEAEPEPEAVPVMEAEPEPEAVPVMEAEPAPEPEPVFKPRLVLEPKFEPEPIFVTNAKLQALSEIESEFAAGTEYGHGLQSMPEEIVEETVTPVAEVEEIVEKAVTPVEEAKEVVQETVTPVAELEQIVEKIVMPAVETEEAAEETVTPVAELEQIVKRIMASAAEPEPEPVPEMSVETKSEPEPVSEMSVEKEPEAESVPVEISDDIKNLILRKMESEEELLEEAFFVRQISKKMAGEKQLNVQRRAEIPGNAAVEKREGKDTRVKKADSVYPSKITITGKDRKSRRKREEGVAKGAVLAAAGLGAFIAGRISKGGD